jgi:hypothetical protein
MDVFPTIVAIGFLFSSYGYQTLAIYRRKKNPEIPYRGLLNGIPVTHQNELLEYRLLRGGID